MNNFFIAIFFIISISVGAQTNTWTGATDTDWHKACNWSLNAIPTCNHDVVIPTVTNYPTITGIAHSRTVAITSAAFNTFNLTSSGGGVLYISNGGGSCAGTATDNGGCGCTNLVFQYYDVVCPCPVIIPPCDVSGPCGTLCYIEELCEVCRTPIMCISPSCDPWNLCGTDCGGFNFYEYAP